MDKLGAYLKDVASEFSRLIVGYLMRLILIYNEHIIIANVVKSVAYEEAFTSRDTEKHLTAIVYVHIGIRISLFGIVDSKALILTRVGYCRRAAVEYIIHV